MSAYESEITQFLRQLKEEKPHLETDQAAGRALLWEKDPINLDERKAGREALVRQKPYVYQTD